MSKELEEIYKEIEYAYDEKIRSKSNKNWEEDYKHYHNLRENLTKLEHSLNRLEAIDNANPSEALECLEELREYGNHFWVADKVEKNYKIIKQALLKQQEQEKVLNEALKLNGEWAEELDYYKELEEQLGCPLEVRCKVVTDSVIYDENGVEYKVVYTYMDYFDCENPFDNEMGYCDLCAFSWVDYKETWFLKKDKSE